MPTVISNTTIVTGNAARTVLHNVAIAIDGDRIAAIGPTAEVMGAYPGANQIDGSNKAVFPGLVNCHTHLLATTDRGISRGLRVSHNPALSSIGPGHVDLGRTPVDGHLGNPGGHPQRHDVLVGNFRRSPELHRKPGPNRAAAGGVGQHQRRGRIPTAGRTVRVLGKQVGRRVAAERRPYWFLAWGKGRQGNLFYGAPCP